MLRGRYRRRSRRVWTALCQERVGNPAPTLVLVTDLEPPAIFGNLVRRYLDLPAMGNLAQHTRPGSKRPGPVPDVYPWHFELAATRVAAVQERESWHVDVTARRLEDTRHLRWSR